MFKIDMQRDEDGTLTKYYTLNCYAYSQDRHQNIHIYSVRNLDEIALARYLQSSIGEPSNDDSDFAFAIVKSGNGPAILTDHGEVMAVPVKSRVEVINGNNRTGKNAQSLLQGAYRTRVSN